MWPLDCGQSGISNPLLRWLTKTKGPHWRAKELLLLTDLSLCLPLFCLSSVLSRSLFCLWICVDAQSSAGRRKDSKHPPYHLSRCNSLSLYTMSSYSLSSYSLSSDSLSSCLLAICLVLKLPACELPPCQVACL